MIDIWIDTGSISKYAGAPIHVCFKILEGRRFSEKVSLGEGLARRAYLDERHLSTVPVVRIPLHSRWDAVRSEAAAFP